MLEVPEDKAFDSAYILKTLMITAKQVYISRFQVKVDIEIAGDWSG